MAKAKSKKASAKKAAPKKNAVKKVAAKKVTKKVAKKAKPAKKAAVKAKPAKKAAPKKAVAKKQKPVSKVAPQKKVAAKVAVPKEKAKPAEKPVKVKTIEKKVAKQEKEKKAKTIEAPRVLKVPVPPTGRPIVAVPPKPSTDDRSRYSEEELREFEQLIQSKLEKAKMEFRILKETLNKTNDSGTDSTSGGNTKVLEDGADTAEKENLSQLAARQQKFIVNLENALIRIKNGTYGICSVTGKLIPKERLMAVPHTTQSIEGKIMQQD